MVSDPGVVVTRSRPKGPPIAFDAFAVATGLALITGGLSLLARFLDSLVVALVAIAVAGWVVERRGTGVDRPVADGFAEGASWCVLAASGVAFALLPSPFELGRGLVLAVGLVPLWIARRRETYRPATAGNSA